MGGVPAHTVGSVAATWCLAVMAGRVSADDGRRLLFDPDIYKSLLGHVDSAARA